MNNGYIPGREVKDGVCWDTHPFAQVTGIRQRHTARYNARLDLCLRGDVSRAGYDDFICRPNLASNQLYFVRDEQPYVLHILALLPPT